MKTNFLNEIHKLYWDRAKSAQYEYYKNIVLWYDKEIKDIKSVLANIDKSYIDYKEFHKKIQVEPANIIDYVDIVTTQCARRKSCADKLLLESENNMNDVFHELNIFREEHSLKPLISLGCSHMEDLNLK